MHDNSFYVTWLHSERLVDALKLLECGLSVRSFPEDRFDVPSNYLKIM
jgi:hypothetical protein